jgi:hypothetical protein
MRASALQRLLRAPRRSRRGLSAIGPCARAPGGLWAEVGDPPGPNPPSRASAIALRSHQIAHRKPGEATSRTLGECRRSCAFPGDGEESCEAICYICPGESSGNTASRKVQVTVDGERLPGRRLEGE